MTAWEFIATRVNIDHEEYKDGIMFLYLAAGNMPDGKVYYTKEYLEEYVVKVLGDKWSVFSMINSDGDEIALGICVNVKGVK